MEIPAPDDFVALPVSERGIRVIGNGVGTSMTARRSLIHGLTEQHWGSTWMPAADPPRVSRRAYEQAVSETFDWLVGVGLLAFDYTQSSWGEWFVITDLGREVASRADGAAYFNAQQLLGVRLHDSIDGRVRRQFLLGETEAAVMIAMKEVEIRMRDAGDLPAELVGIKLATAAFKPGEGPLHDPDAEGGEQEAAMSLFRGAMGIFRNPVAHRRVDYDDPVEAVEVILFADLLLRMIDRAAAART
jgi:uncharacterized protein (TIGR02391 family)